MNARTTPLSLAAIALALTIPSCGEDGPTGGGNQDTTPPTIASVTAIDAHHIQVVFNEALYKPSAERSWYYRIVESGPQPVPGSAAAPGDPIYMGGAMLAGDQRTVSLSTDSPMTGVDYDLYVWNVKDVAGNAIDEAMQSFVGNDAADVTPPELVSRTPGPNAVNVPVGVAVVLKFSESVSISDAAWTSDGEVVKTDSWAVGDRLTMSLYHTLAPGSHNTITISNIQDTSGNPMPDIQWSFTATTVEDNTPPRLISSVPANFATNVSTRTNISLTFSEPLHPNTRFVTIIPYLDVFVTGVLENGGKTLVVDTSSLFKDDQQYTIWLEPAYFLDLSGNSLNQATTVTFTTGRTLASGSIAGKITGDPGTGASDPTGASVIAEGDSILMAGTVAGNDTYALTHMPDDIYQVIAVKESNNDGNLDFYLGDAIGAYGVNAALHDLDPDNVGITSGAQVTGINFPIYDPSAVWGTLSYNGSYQGEQFEYLGLFKTAGFDPHNPSVSLLVASTEAYRDSPWFFNTLFDEIPDGDYYLAAYLDVNDDGLDLSVDPYNWYGGPGAPIALHLFDGHDVGDIVLPLSDPVPGLASAGHTAPWRAKKENATFKHLGDVVRKSQLAIQQPSPGSR